MADGIGRQVTRSPPQSEFAEAERHMYVHDGSAGEWEPQKTRLQWRANRQGAFTP